MFEAMLPHQPEDYSVMYIDMDSFFASAEQQRRPELRGRPVGVCPYIGEGSCVVACSREAKRYGVKTGMRVREARLLAPNSITAAEKNDVAKAAEAQKAALEQIQATATARQAEIRAKIKDILANLANDKKAQIEQISKDVVDKIAALPEIPKNISKDARAKLVEQRQEEIDKIRGDAKTKIQSVSSGAQAKKDSEVASSRSSTEQIKSDVKASVESARSKYQELRQALKDKYDTIRQQEQQAIKANV